MSGTGAVVNVFTFGGSGLLCQRINGVDGFFTFDPSGNTVQSLSSSQSVNYSHLVTGFGSQLSGGSTSDAYDGLGAQWGYRRESGNLFLLGHRYYSSARGQFLTRDPIDYDGGINLYGYTENDPVNENDPDGTFGLPPAPVVGEAGTAVGLGGGPEDPIGDGVGLTIILAYYGNQAGNGIASWIPGQDGLPADPSCEHTTTKNGKKHEKHTRKHSGGKEKKDPNMDDPPPKKKGGPAMGSPKDPKPPMKDKGPKP